MMFAHVYNDLGRVTGDDDALQRAVDLANIVFTLHVKPEKELLYELIRPNGDLADTDEGNTYLAGHAIESMWFMERIYRDRPEREERMSLARNVIRWNLEKAWDEEYGGLFLACNAAGGTPVWHQPDAKVWWPHTEALYALLRFHELYQEPWMMDWYWRMHEYSFRVFPDAEHGDWHQNLDRQGRITEHVIKNLAVKDPFHLPRALIYSIDSLRRLAESGG